MSALLVGLRVGVPGCLFLSFIQNSPMVASNVFIYVIFPYDLSLTVFRGRPTLYHRNSCCRVALSFPSGMEDNDEEGSCSIYPVCGSSTPFIVLSKTFMHKIMMIEQSPLLRCVK